MLRRHWNNLKYLARHKYFVARECFRLGLYWQGIIHDFSKLRPSEWNAYAAFFDAPSPKSDDVYARFNKAWASHIRRNPHHWQHFIILKDRGGKHVFEMPVKYAKEMVADWKGAGMAINGSENARAWYLERQKTIVLHPNTRKLVEGLLDIP